jgi:hypothetical protein
MRAFIEPYILHGMLMLVGIEAIVQARWNWNLNLIPDRSKRFFSSPQ